jgi:hypothetical protein
MDYIDFKNNYDTHLISDTEGFTNIDEIVIRLFFFQTFITKLLKARENILSQTNNGKLGYFMFSYPGLAWVQYDHNSIRTLYSLVSMKTKAQLYKIYKNTKIKPKLRLHAIAALLIKCGEHFYNLYNGLDKARRFTKDNRLVYIDFVNPFPFIITNKISKKYTGEDIIELHEIALGKRFNSIFPEISQPQQ